MAAQTAKTNLSLNDIAEALGLSKATVSWVLSGKGDSRRISPATQKRVKEFAAKHNYQPNMLARSLSIGRSKTIGLLISSLSDPFYSSIAKAVVSQAEKQGYTVMIATSESDCKREASLVSTFSYRKVDGIIVTPTEGADWVDSFTNAGGRLVFADRAVPGSDIPSVVVDNEQSSYRLVSNLIEKGCRKIAMFTTAHNLVNMKARQAGYVRALEDAGIPVDTRLIRDVTSVYNQKMVEDELDDLLRLVPDLDGFFFTTHVLVLPTYVHFTNRGIMPQGGAGWACFHSLPGFEILLPNMSIARMSIEQVGARAVDLLLENIENGTDARGTTVTINCEMKLH
ncbi:MAG: LacI family DNA-binding transcriptional regulator [Bacteroidales bacterium]|nr:LacI family DNA-binding transcriptional regulator [Bacteroidales bacterium]